MSIPLRFPMLVKVAPDTRFEIFPEGDFSAYPNVEYHIGYPSVCFVVKQIVVMKQPQCFLAQQLSSQITGEVGGTIKVTLKDHDPLLFPVIFGYMNQTFEEPSAATISTTGLSKAEVDTVEHLVKEFFAMDDLCALLLKSKHPLFNADGVSLEAKGRTYDRQGKRVKLNAENLDDKSIKATISSDGIISCTAEGDFSMTINLREIPTDGRAPKSLMGEETVAKLKSARGSSLLCGDSPGTEINPYPDVDQKTVFFIPASAIVCMIGKTRVFCEGVYRCEEEYIRIDAVDQFEFHWLWLEVTVT
jgi:hypothetical protein